MALKTISKPCFSNGTECMDWLEINCYRCKKCYTIDRNGDNHFHCVIQADIVHQMIFGGNEDIRQISYDATQTRTCPRFIKYGTPPKHHRAKKCPPSQTSIDFPE